MSRILAIDFGTKRVGLATTDPQQIIASALDTISNEKVLHFLEKYIEKESVEMFVLGLPKNLDNTPTDSTKAVQDFAQKLQAKFPNIPIEFQDERFTSKIAFNAIIQGGKKKKYRQDKGNIDKISAVIILQDFLERKNLNR